MSHSHSSTRSILEFGLPNSAGISHARMCALNDRNRERSASGLFPACRDTSCGGCGARSVKTLEETQKLTATYRVEKTVLQVDALEVDARLAKARYELSTAEDGLTTQREHLNQLLGREITTDFRPDPMIEDDPADLTFEATRLQALQNRPEIREAKLKEKQADYDRRLAKAEYIPDLGLPFSISELTTSKCSPRTFPWLAFCLRGSRSTGDDDTITSPRKLER